MAWIRKMLDLSTSYLPKQYGAADSLLDNPLNAAPGVIAYRTDYGFVMWVPDDPTESDAAMADNVPEEILAIQMYARSLGCDWVMFDSDGDTEVTDLPKWNW